MTLKETLVRDYNKILNTDSPLELSQSLESTYEVLLKNPYVYPSEEDRQKAIIKHISQISSYIHAKIENNITNDIKIKFETTYGGLIYLLKHL